MCNSCSSISVRGISASASTSTSSSLHLPQASNNTVLNHSSFSQQSSRTHRRGTNGQTNVSGGSNPPPGRTLSSQDFMWHCCECLRNGVPTAPWYSGTTISCLECHHRFCSFCPNDPRYSGRGY